MNLNESSFSLQSALFLAQASKLAYSSPATAKPGAIKSLGFKTARFISKKDTQLFVAQSPSAILVAFRGTQQIKDWLTNLDSMLLKVPLGEVHRRFYEALQLVWPNIDHTIKTYSDNSQKIWFTGHSLGGALAMLAASMFLDKPEQLGGLYTFGQPRIGNEAFTKNFDVNLKSKTYRFVNNNDIVPRVPPRKMDYSDAGQFRYFNIFGQMYSDPKTWQLFLNSMGGMAEKALSRYNELNTFVLNNAMMDWVSDHGLENYIANIQKNIDKKV